MEEQRPQTDGSPRIERRNDPIICNPEEINYAESRKTCKKQTSKRRTAAFSVRDQSHDKSPDKEPDDITEGRAKYIPYSTAPGEYGDSQKPERDIHGHADRAPLCAEQHSGERNKKCLQCDGYVRNGDFYERAHRHKCGKECAENEIFYPETSFLVLLAIIHDFTPFIFCDADIISHIVQIVNHKFKISLRFGAV